MGHDAIQDNSALSQHDAAMPVVYTRVTCWCAAGVILLALCGIAGWTIAPLLWASGLPGMKPMAPSAAVLLLLMGLLLLGYQRHRHAVWYQLPAIILATLISFFTLVETYAKLSSTGTSLEESILHRIPAWNTSIAFISPMAAVLIYLSSISFLLMWQSSLRQHPGGKMARFAGYLSLLIIFGALIFELSYAYQNPFLSSPGDVPIAFTSALACLLLGVALAASLGPWVPPSCWFAGNSTPAVLRRTFIPILLVALFAADLLQALVASLFNINTALIYAIAIAAFTGLAFYVVMRVARVIGGAIDRVETELHREQERLRVTLHSIGDATIATDNAGNITLLNGVAEQMTGWTQEEAVGRSILDVFHIVNETTRALTVNPVEKVLASGLVEGLANHTVLIARDGTEHAIADSGAPIRDNDGKIIGVILVFRDVTEERVAERALRVSEEHFRRVFEDGPIGMAISDAHFHFLRANAAFCRMLGYTEEEFSTLTFSDITHPDHLEHDAEEIDRLVRGDISVYRVEKRYLAKDRSTHWGALSLSVVRDADGIFQYYLAMIEDITYGRLMEEQLVLSAEILRLLNHADEAIDNIHDILRIIKAFTGFEAVAIRLMDGNDYPYYSINGFPEDFGEAENYLCSYLPNGQLIRDAEGRVELACMCGTVIAGHTDPNQPFFTAGGSFWSSHTTQMLATTTEKDRQGHTRNHCNAEGYESVALIPLRGNGHTIGLLQLNDRRPGMLSEEMVTFFEGIGESIGIALARRQSEEQLRQVAKMESIGRLAGGVAHDFNNILTGIIGLTHITLSESAADSPQRSELEEVLGLAHRAANLTSQLLSFSRRQPSEPQPLNLNNLIENSCKMLRRLIGEDVELRVVADPHLGSAYCDPGQVDQVLMNLAVNARDAMPNGGHLTIETTNVLLDESYVAAHVEMQPGAYVLLSVSDTGCGMDNRTQQHIFEPFFTTKEVGKGTGLGLATVYGIVRQHGGYIWVYSEVDEGTTFKIYLPRHDISALPHFEDDGQALTARGRETILLVEDEESVRKVTQRILDAHGYRVLSAASPMEAELLFQQYQGDISLLLTDIIMPGCTGVELHQRLHALDPSLRALLMSGYSGDALPQHITIETDVPPLEKPFMPVELLNRIRQLLDATDDGEKADGALQG